MKFGRQLEEEEGSAPAGFAGDFIAYKRLKMYLKYRQLNSANTRETTLAEAEEAEKDFLRLLYQELKRVDRRFEKEAHRVLSAYELQNARCKCLAAMHALLTCRPGAASSKAAEKLALQARWCRRYAELNYLALRKIAKKRDRLLGGRVGEEFIQACLRGEVKARAFMSAPLLAELAAIEQMMLDKAGKRAEGHEPTTPASTSSPVVQAGEEQRNTADQPPASSSVPECSDIDQDCICAICLDLLYQPVSLSCGHILCARCALAAAVGHQKMYGLAEQLLMSAAGASEKPCPCCRTALYGGRKEKESVFWDVKRLHRLEHLIQQKYPADYQRRKEEDAADQAALKAARPTAWRSLRHLTSDASQ